MSAIRAARLEDAGQIREIYAPNVTEAFISFEAEPPTAGEMRERIAKTLATHPWLVHDEGGRILGYAYATLEERNWNDLLDACGKLNDLYVDAGARRRGVARALVEATFGWFRERKAPRVVLLSAWQNADAHAFFESLGFRRTMLEMTAEVEP